MTDVITGVLALVGSAFTLLAGIGVLRFPDTLSRMHAATKAMTLGLLLIAVGSALQLQAGIAKLVFAVGLVFLTAPLAAHLIGRSSYRAGGVGVRLDEVDELAAAEETGDAGTGGEARP